MILFSSFGWRNFTNPKPLSGPPAAGRRTTSRLKFGVSGPHGGPTSACAAAAAAVVSVASSAKSLSRRMVPPLVDRSERDRGRLPPGYDRTGVEFRILGPLEVWHEGRQAQIEGAKERALLAFLLLHAGEPVSVDRLIDELWGDSPPATARKSVQVRVAGLRRAIRGDVLLTLGDAYLVQLEPTQLDLHRFEQLLSDGSHALAAGDPSAALMTVHEALALWRGPPLVDFTYESFAQPAIARLEELRVHALELRIEAELDLGRHARVITELEDLVAAHPFRE